MTITGQHFIAGERTAGTGEAFTAENPATGKPLPGEFADATTAQVDRCLEAADEAFEALQIAPVETIGALLESIADGLESAGEELLERAHAETALPMARLTGERGRTTGQTRMFARLARDGSWRQARVDRGDADRQPQPKPDVRTLLTGVGPVAVFGASNFPLAISVAGTDTVAALAARCPVVVKAHPGHPGTCELIAQVISRAVVDAGLPGGTFSMVHGRGHAVGLALVEHPLTAAVAFTGSLRGGRALADAAAARPVPIPVYAEMGSTNPVFLLPGALAERGPQIAGGFLQSVNMGVGQFCTNPGTVLGIDGDPLRAFLATTAAGASATPPATMLHSGIYSAFSSGVQRIVATPGVEQLSSTNGGDRTQAACTIFTAPVSALDSEPHLADEVFGPASIVYRCNSTADMLTYARTMPGSLTATIHGTDDDLAENAELVRLLERKVGRIVFNGFPTGIEVCAAMHHGGPYPATNHSHFTSIGHAAIYRFTRPVCYQNFPNAALPPELQDSNPRGMVRLVDGELSRDAIHRRPDRQP